MKRNFECHKKLANFYFKPLPKYPTPPNKLYVLAYIATLELKKLEKTKGESVTIGHKETSPFVSIPKKIENKLSIGMKKRT
jgi:hypothetical protein